MCDRDTGQCVCRTYVTGLRCDVCMDGAAQFGIDAITGCLECRCNEAGTRVGETCDKDTSVCACRTNVAGLSCNLCKSGYWNLSIENPDGCESCNCDLTGANSTCDQNTGQCSCLPNRIGTKCSTCARGFYKAPQPLRGCLPCRCSNLTSSGLCDPENGQCQCRVDRLGVGGQNCDECLPGFWGYDAATGSCKRCDCFWPGVVGGLNALHPCDSKTGQCKCKDFVTGMKCDKCKDGYSVLAQDNPYGCSSAPSQQPPPRLIDSNSSTLAISWPPPVRPNGIIRRYVIRRNATQVANISLTDKDTYPMTFVDANLEPLHFYEYRVVAFTDNGNTSSIPVVFLTLNGAPVGNTSFKASIIEDNAVNLEWTFETSSMTTEEIDNMWYEILQASDGEDSKQVWRGQNAISTRISSLTAFTSYSFLLKLCNQRSECLLGGELNLTTKEAPPELQPNPKPTTLSTDSIYVEWDPPERPNGVISFYELWMREVPTKGPNASLTADNDTDVEFDRVLIFHPAGMWIRQRSAAAPITSERLPLPPPDRNYTVTNLKANRIYEFQIVVQNNVGKTESGWTSAKTMEAPPSKGIDAYLKALSSSSIEVTWPDPANYVELGGTVMNITLYVLKKAEKNTFGPVWEEKLEKTFSVNQKRVYIVNQLLPYHQIGVKLEACTRLGCINGSVVYGSTLSGVPQGLQKPTVRANSSTITVVEWQEPRKPNGPPPLYSVIRSLSSFAEPQLKVERGVRFPGAHFMEFSPELLPLSTEFFGIEFWFKTTQRNALLFLAASDDEEELVAIQLVDGVPYVLADPKGCRGTDQKYATVTTDGGFFFKITYDDNQWHHFRLFKDAGNMKIELNTVITAQKEITCANNTVIGEITKFFVGGVPRNFILYRNNDPEIGSDETKMISLNSFKGCIRDFKILTARSPKVVWTPLQWKNSVATSFTPDLLEGCPVELSPGVHFLGNGFVTMPSVSNPSTSVRIPPPTSFTGGNAFKIEISFRAEFRTGLLFFQYSPITGHILFAQLNDSTLEIGLLSGIDIATQRANVTMSRLTHNNFCDTKKKTLKISKIGSQLTFETSDNVGQPFKVDFDLQSAYFFLTSDIYIGGIGGPGSDAAAFVKQYYKDIIITNSFGGCLLQFDIYSAEDETSLKTAEPKPILDYLRRYGNSSMVLADGCPPIEVTPSLQNTCKSPNPKVVYEGRQLSTIDEGLSPFSTYLYSVNASNEAGSTLSLWSSGRTQPLPPEESGNALLNFYSIFFIAFIFLYSY